MENNWVKNIMDWIVWGDKEPYAPDRQEEVDNLIDNEIKDIKYETRTS